MRESRARFIRQQGFSTQRADEQFYSALMLQPRIIGVIVVLGTAVQSPWIFLALTAALWWSALVPVRSLFDAIYNHAVARRRGFPPLDAAPPPRRFAAAVAGSLTFAIGMALLAGAVTPARVLEALLLIAVIQVVFRDVCAGANLYHLLHRTRMAAPSPSSDPIRR
jgi:hypothetical protein